MTRLAIFDYGAGNLFSLESSIRKNGGEASVNNKRHGYVR